MNKNVLKRTFSCPWILQSHLVQESSFDHWVLLPRFLLNLELTNSIPKQAPKDKHWFSLLLDKSFNLESIISGLFCWTAVKNLPEMQETWVRSLGWEDPLEEEMATYSSILAWEVPRTEESGRLKSMGRKESDMTEYTHTSISREVSFLPCPLVVGPALPCESSLVAVSCFPLWGTQT